MRTKVTLALIFLNIALFAFIFYVRSGDSTISETPGILGPEVVNIQKLEITIAGRAPVRLERRGETWSLVDPVEWPANPFALTVILNELQQLRSQASFAVKDLDENGQSLADYGLEKPPITVTFTPAPDGGSEATAPVSLRIGDTVKVGNRLYVLSPDGERVHVVNRSLAESLSVNLDELRSNTVFSIPVFEVRSLNLQTGAPANLRVRIARANSRWHFESPITTRADKNETEVTISRLNGLRIDDFVDPRSTDALRLSPEEMSLRVTLEGNNRRETLILGGRARDPQPQVGPAGPEAQPEAVEYYYGKMDDKSPVFTVAIVPSFLERLHAAQETLRDRQILDVDPAAVTAITLLATGQPELTLQRLESTSPVAGGSSWQIARRAAESGPQTVPADREAVARLLQRICTLKAERFQTDAPSEAALEDFGFNRPARRIRITVGPTSGEANGAAERNNSVVLLLGIGVDRNVYAKLDSPNYVYRVDNDILQHIPVTPLDYRQRVLRDLPEGARIAGLQLTDLAEGSVLLDTTVPPSEGTIGGTGKATAGQVDGLATQLRTIRAKQFIREEFARTITVMGEERPWRYQLVCTLALVGGDGAQTETFTLFFSERTGGTTQLVGTPQFDLVFEAEQPLIDALFAIVYGPRDPGPPEPSPSSP